MFDEFKEKLKQHKELNSPLIIEALNFATQAHKNQSRHSGQNYIIHPVEVAINVMEAINDTPAVIAALLHDVVEDTDIHNSFIEKKFGSEVAHLVDGVTKLAKVNFKSKEHAKVENFRKFVLSLASDIRVLVIKLADRLHNIQTLHHISKPEKRREIALETLDIYVPLAERIGLINIKSNLENLCFEILQPKTSQLIKQRLKAYKESCSVSIIEIEQQFQGLLTSKGIKSLLISSRVKREFSIWKKMDTNNADFEDLRDIFAIRIIVSTIPQCYEVLGVIHKKYKSFFQGFKDYISNPKDNGYRSLHTCVFLKPDLKLEIQIRTSAMHKMAEEGFAAHWSYKNTVKSKDMKNYMWLRNVLEIINSPFLGKEEQYEYARLEMFEDTVFAFTPKGKIISLPKNSTILDFAYRIHTDLGNMCAGAKVNGSLLPIYAKVKNGDTLNIITAKDQEPDLLWMNIAKTGYARSAIRRYWKESKSNNNNINYLLRHIIEPAFSKVKLTFNDKILGKILQKYNISSIELYNNIVNGTIVSNHLIQAAYPGKIDHKITEGNLFYSNDKNLTSNNKVELAKCCLPIKGDAIVGVIGSLGGINIHRKICKALVSGVYDECEKFDVFWADKNTHYPFLSVLNAELTNISGSAFRVTKVFAKENINLIELHNEYISDSTSLLLLTFTIADLTSLNHLITKLKARKEVIKVERYNGTSKIHNRVINR